LGTKIPYAYIWSIFGFKKESMEVEGAGRLQVLDSVHGHIIRVSS
jgi:hypothetical protein